MLLPDLKQTCIFEADFSVKLPSVKLHGNPSSVSRAVTCWREERQTGTSKLVGDFPQHIILAKMVHCWQTYNVFVSCVEANDLTPIIFFCRSLSYLLGWKRLQSNDPSQNAPFVRSVHISLDLAARCVCRHNSRISSYLPPSESVFLRHTSMLSSNPVFFRMDAY
jgi:hypothetical protein